jgi:hypothetical protein
MLEGRPALGRAATASTTVKADVINHGTDTAVAYVAVTIEDQDGKAYILM